MYVSVHIELCALSKGLVYLYACVLKNQYICSLCFPLALSHVLYWEKVIYDQFIEYFFMRFAFYEM